MYIRACWQMINPVYETSTLGSTILPASYACALSMGFQAVAPKWYTERRRTARGRGVCEPELSPRGVRDAGGGVCEAKLVSCACSLSPSQFSQLLTYSLPAK